MEWNLRRPILYYTHMPILVSVVTPTYQRRRFIPALLEVYRHQTFPKEQMEWIILDDGRDLVEDLFQDAAKTIPHLRYLKSDEKMRIGAKRNRLNQEARGEIIIAMDDDDYYPPERIQTVVDAFRKNPQYDLAGSSEMYFYDMKTQLLYSSGPFGPRHATNGTMAWRKRYSDVHRYDEYVTHAEEASFLQNSPMIQLDPKKTILVMCHGDNTVEKIVSQQSHPTWKRLSYSLKEMVTHPFLLSWYQTHT